MKKILLSIFTIALVATVTFGATQALFSDTETSEGNTFTAGELDLKIDGLDEPNVAHITLSNMKPGDKLTKFWYWSNAGSVEGKPWIEIVNVTDSENGCNEPEAIDDSTCDEPNGELSEALMVQVNAPGDVALMYPHGSCINFGNQCTLNYWSSLGRLDGGVDGQDWGTIQPGVDPEFAGGPMVLYFELPSTVGNEVQSDSVSFDVIFHLDQVTP